RPTPPSCIIAAVCIVKTFFYFGSKSAQLTIPAFPTDYFVQSAKLHSVFNCREFELPYITNLCNLPETSLKASSISVQNARKSYCIIGEHFMVLNIFQGHYRIWIFQLLRLLDAFHCIGNELSSFCGCSARSGGINPVDLLVFARRMLGKKQKSNIDHFTGDSLEGTRPQPR